MKSVGEVASTLVVGALLVAVLMLPPRDVARAVISLTVDKSFVKKDSTFTVTVVDDTLSGTDAGGVLFSSTAVNRVNIAVKNVTRDISATMRGVETGLATNTYKLTVTVKEQLTPVTTEDSEVIPGFHSDTLQVNYAFFTRQLLVDNVLPIISGVAPPHLLARKPGVVTFAADVTDADSGFTGEVEKLNTANQGTIVLTIQSGVVSKNEITWVKIPGGWHFEVSLGLGTSGAELSIPWRIDAVDAAGNGAILDRTLIVDGKGPTLASAATGEWWGDPDPVSGIRLKKGHDAKRTSLHVSFTDLSGLDAATVAPGDFSVDGVTPVSVLVVDQEGADPQRPKDVFLTLPADLVSDARPSVRIVGQVVDRAGNISGFGETVQAADGLPPRLTVELGATLSRGDVEIFVEGDERLNGAPTVKLSAQITATGGLGAFASPTVTQTATAANRYKALSLVTAIPAANASRRINVEVSALDLNNIHGRIGETNATLSGAITYELDPLLNNGQDPEFVVAGVPLLPGGIVAGGSLAVIEAVDPITVLVDFSRQCTAATCSNGGEAKEYEGDTHKTVQLTYTAATVTPAGGARRSLPVTVAASDGIRFVLIIPGVILGDYQVVVQAKDEAGNVSKSPTSTVPDPLENRFTLVAAEPFEISLAPGWNLISFPFTPADPAINTVIPRGHLISLVMGFDKGAKAWQVSQRDAVTGLFVGDVKVMTATTGYFVLTNAFQPLRVSRPTVSGASVPPPPPAIEVLKGWNLIPVLSRAAPLPREADADDYLRLVIWEKAIGYSPLTRVWESVERGVALKTLILGDPPYTTPCGVTHVAPKIVKSKVCLGKAYWLWASENGTIVP
jgi:hypothetical protein